MKYICSLVLSILIIVGCTQANIDNDQKQTAEQSENIESMCTDGGRVKDGIYIYENNVWGADENLPYNQCILIKNINGKKKYGWKWDWKGQAPNWVFSYPEIIVGWKPWGDHVPTDPLFPAKIADIKQLSIRYDVTIEATGQYNLAPEIWLIRERPDTFPLEEPEKLITTELMFWMDHTEMARPAGTKITSFELGGKMYDLWLREDHNNSGDTVSWTIYSIVSKEKQLKGEIDIIGFINTLIELGHDISPDEYVATVEFGTEVMGVHHQSSSVGTAWINDYEVSYKLK